MAATKDPSRTAAKWARVSAQRGEDYAAGIAAPRVPWAAASAAANERYKQGVMDAAGRNAFAKGIAAAGDQRWQAKSRDKGPNRYAEGVQLSGPDYQAGVQPYLDTIASTVLPPRFPRGDQRNLARVATLAAALRKRKTG